MSMATKRADGVFTIDWESYRKTHRDHASIWTTIRADIPGECRDLWGRRTLMAYDEGTCLLIEGRGLVIEGAPRAHRLMLDPKYKERDVYILEFLNDAGEWEGLGYGLSPQAAQELAKHNLSPRTGRGWTITYIEEA